MKVEFFENEHGTDFQLTPETVEEVAALARIAQNTKSEKPDITFYFREKPSMIIWMKKIDKFKQINELSNTHQIRSAKK